MGAPLCPYSEDDRTLPLPWGPKPTLGDSAAALLCRARATAADVDALASSASRCRRSSNACGAMHAQARNTMGENSRGCGTKEIVIATNMLVNASRSRIGPSAFCTSRQTIQISQKCFSKQLSQPVQRYRSTMSTVFLAQVTRGGKHNVLYCVCVKSKRVTHMQVRLCHTSISAGNKQQCFPWKRSHTDTPLTESPTHFSG